MASKTRKVSYQHPPDKHADYMIPLQSDHNILVYTKPKSSENTSSISSSATTVPSGGFFTSVYFPLSLLLYVSIPVTQLVIGFIYIGQCPVQQMIVVWMIIAGTFGLILVASGLIIHVYIHRQSLSLSPYNDLQSYPLIIRILIPVFILVLLFTVVWFFVGQVFIFEVKLRVEFYDATLPEYCHGVLYKTAYILIFIDYLIFLLVIILNVLSYVSPPDDNDSKNNNEKSDAQFIS